MDFEQVRKIDGWKKVSCILFAVLLVLNGVLVVMLLSANAKLKEHNQILVTVPSELKANIEHKFSQAADDTKTEILTATTATSNQIKQDAKDKANETAKQIEKRSAQELSGISQQNKLALDLMAKKLEELETKIASNSAYAKSADGRLSEIDKQIKAMGAAADKTGNALKTADENLANRIADAEKKNTTALEQRASSMEKQLREQGIGTRKQLVDINTTAKKSLAYQEKFGGEVAKLGQRIELVVQENNRKQTNADAAFDMAKKAAASGDLHLAKIYALNAISHRQNKVDYLRFYVDIVVNSPNATAGELSQVLAILDVSLYNVPADDIRKILALKEQVGQRKNQIDARSAVPAINLGEELKSISNGQYALKNIITGNNIDVNKLQKRIEKINALLGEELTDEWREQLTKTLQESSNIYSAYLTIKSVTNALDKAASHAEQPRLTDKQILSARNQLSTATTLLAQIWTLKLPRNIVERAEEIQKRISDVDEKLNALASRDAMDRYDIIAEKLKNIREDVSNNKAKYYADETAKKKANKIYYGSGILTEYLKDIQECVAELQTLRIFDKEGQKKAIATLRSAQELALKVSAKRYQAYQLWAIDKISKALESRDSVSTFKPYTNAQAISDFKDYLMDIDRGLLTYDVGMCYDKAFYVIFTDQVPTSRQAGLQIEKATFEKMGKLEDF